MCVGMYFVYCFPLHHMTISEIVITVCLLCYSTLIMFVEAIVVCVLPVLFSFHTYCSLVIQKHPGVLCANSGIARGSGSPDKVTGPPI